MGSAIWAANGNPNCRLPVTSRPYVGLPSRVSTFGRYFFWQVFCPNARISTTGDQVVPYLFTGRTLLGEFRSACLRVCDLSPDRTRPKDLVATSL